MPIASQTMIDPLQAFTAGAYVAGTPRPCPLVATTFDVTIDAGLALVVMRRTFRNAEAGSIEATITFPLPVHATLFALEASIGERVLVARAARKDAARRTYEDALEGGKGTVLHEEVLRGVHMLSVGQLAPGGEIEVRATWAITLTHLNGRGRLRIPLTVGDIYGRSGLADSDDLIHGAPVQCGLLTVTCRDGVASLIGGRLEEGRADIPLNAPIDLDVTGWTPRALAGRMADGSAVALRVQPLAGGEGALDVALLVDRSGSMSEMCSALDGLTKHEAAVSAIEQLADGIGHADAVDVWEFAAKLKHVGSTRERPLRDVARLLDGPDGGTEIGHAINGVVEAARAGDVLLVTDGKSHALDVQALARTGRRFSLVLVGADSLEAHVGRLAALTGGEIFVSAGPDLPAMLGAAIRSLRMPHRAPQFDRREMRERRAGMELIATWSVPGGSAERGKRSVEERAVAAIAAGIVLPTFDTEAATELAQAEGLVTHLTSLVLVDEAGAAQEGIPAARKIALPSPATDPMAFGARRVGAARITRYQRPLLHEGVPDYSAELPRRTLACIDDDYLADFMEPRLREEVARSLGAPASARRRPRLTGGAAPPPVAAVDLAALAAYIDWDAAPQRLQSGDLAGLDGALADMIRRIAAELFVVQEARNAGCDPVVFVIALLAKAVGRRNRTADRIARAILGERVTDEVLAETDRLVRAW